ncbi:hypothetical protein MSG28_006946, partial [Choristoneura fumiferana]
KSFQAAGNTESASAAPDTRNSRELTLRRLCGLQRERGHASSHHNTRMGLATHQVAASRAGRWLRARLCAPQTTAALVITPMVNRFVIASEKQLPPYHETALASRNTTCTRQKCEERV